MCYNFLSETIMETVSILSRLSSIVIVWVLVEILSFTVAFEITRMLSIILTSINACNVFHVVYVFCCFECWTVYSYHRQWFKSSSTPLRKFLCFTALAQPSEHVFVTEIMSVIFAVSYTLDLKFLTILCNSHSVAELFIFILSPLILFLNCN